VSPWRIERARGERDASSGGEDGNNNSDCVSFSGVMEVVVMGEEGAVRTRVIRENSNSRVDFLFHNKLFIKKISFVVEGGRQEAAAAGSRRGEGR
jgi:hypothetical protein